MNYIIRFLFALFLCHSLAVSTVTVTSKQTRPSDFKLTTSTTSSPCDLGGVTAYTSPIPFHGDGTVSPTKIVTSSIHHFYNGTNFVSSLPANTDIYCLGFTIFDEVDTSPHTMFLSVVIGDEKIVTNNLKYGAYKTYWFTSTEPSLTFWVTGYYEDQISYVFYKGFTIDTWKNTIVNFYMYNNGYNFNVNDFASDSESASMIVSNSDYTSDFDNNGVVNPYFFWSMNKDIYTVYFGSTTSFIYPRYLDLTLFKINICYAYSTLEADCPIYNLTPAINTIGLGQLLYVLVTPGKVYQFIAM